jgi:hypothetical protein
VSTGQHRPTIRPASEEDLDDLQDLACRTIDTCYRAFLGDEAVDRFIASGASDAHVKHHLERGGVLPGDQLTDEGPAKIEYIKSGTSD